MNMVEFHKVWLVVKRVGLAGTIVGNVLDEMESYFLSYDDRKLLPVNN
jgi:hypothetical protein